MACNLIDHNKRFVIDDKHEMISVTMVVLTWPLINKWGRWDNWQQERRGGCTSPHTVGGVSPLALHFPVRN